MFSDDKISVAMAQPILDKKEEKKQTMYYKFPIPCRKEFCIMVANVPTDITRAEAMRAVNVFTAMVWNLCQFTDDPPELYGTKYTKKQH